MNRAGSLCTGIMGLDIAAHAVYGTQLAWYSEIEPAAVTVIEQHTSAPNLGDLTTIDWHAVPPVDVLTAGYPCQPFSHAGNRKGASDDRHLWPYIADAIRVLRPRRVVLENVAGHLSLGFDVVLGDLAAAGFDAEWCVLRASDVGAPHQRARLFVVATDTRRAERGTEGGPRGEARQLVVPGERHESATPSLGDHDPARDTDGSRADPLTPPSASRDATGEPSGPAADAGGERLQGWPEPHERTVEPGLESPRRGDADRLGVALADTHGTPGGLVVPWSGPSQVPGAEVHERPQVEPGRCDRGDQGAEPLVAWGAYEPAIRRWECILRRPAPEPTDDRGRLRPPFVEWMMGYPEGWVDGLGRTQALKALGNAVVPPQGSAALGLLEA